MIDYFKRISDRLFKVDENGRTLFYPWGSLGKGYIVTDKKTEAKIRNFIAYYYACCLISIAAFFFTDYMKYSFMLLLPVFIVWEIGIRSFTKNLVATEIRLTFSESMKIFAQARSRVFLLLAAVVSIIFVALSIATFITQKSMWSGLSVVFFIVIALLNWYVLRLKDN
jgi:hypothetical protein